MACTVTYKGKKYSEQEFLEMLNKRMGESGRELDINPKSKTYGSIFKSEAKAMDVGEQAEVSKEVREGDIQEAKETTTPEKGIEKEAIPTEVDVSERKKSGVERAMDEPPKGPPDKPPPPTPEEPSADMGGKRKFKLPIDFIVSKWNKKMKARGLLPKELFQRWVRTQGEVRSKAYDVEVMERKFKKALMEEYGGDNIRGLKVDPSTIESLNTALGKMGTGEGRAKALESVPERIRGPLTEMRDQVDALSREMVRMGIVEGELAAKFDKNMGFYLTRTYKVHNDKSWKWENIPDEIKNRAISYLKSEYPEKTIEQIDAQLRSWLQEQDMPFGYIKTGSLGAKDRSIIELREDIHVTLRDLLGEYKDPMYNYATSVFKMADLIAREKFLRDVREMGMDKFLFEEPTGKNITKIAAEASEVMAPLNGLYTTPELAEAFNTFDKYHPYRTELGLMYAKLNSGVKYGKTIMSPQTHVRNYNSNFILQLANGRLFNLKGGAKDLVRFRYARRTDPEYKAYVKRAIELGVLRDNARAGEMYDIVKDAHKALNDPNMTLDTWVDKPLKRMNKGFQKAYQIEDDVHKLYAYGVELERYEPIIRKRNPSMTDAEIRSLTEEKAADIVRNTMPTYSLVPEMVKMVRRIPLVGTFVSFPAEIMRTTWNVADISIREMSDPDTRSIGITRMAGLLAAATVTVGVEQASLNLFGMIRDDKKDLVRFFPSWTENSDIMIIKKPKDGVFTYIDLGYSDPLNYLKKGVNAYLNNIDDPSKGITELVGEIVSPFMDEELLASKLIDVGRNSQQENGLPVYNKEDTKGQQVAEALKYLWDDLQPGLITSVKRIIKGARKEKKGSLEYNLAEEVVAVGFGARISTVNVGESFKYKMNDYRRRISDARFIYKEVLNKEDMSTAKRSSAYKRANKSLESIIKEAHKDYASALRLGAPKKILDKYLYGTYGVSDVDATMIRRGRFIPMVEERNK